MGEREAMLALERALGPALRAENPVAVLAAVVVRSPELRGLLDGVDEDGLRIAALLVARLRFERLMQGSRRAREWHDTDPDAFATAFRDYHRDVPSTGLHPWEEAESFARWVG